MSLVSEAFLLFVILLIFVYYIVPSKYQWICLLVFSLCFYLASGSKNIVFILSTTFSAYICTRYIERIHKETKAYIKEHKKLLSKEERKAYKEKKNNLTI